MRLNLLSSMWLSSTILFGSINSPAISADSAALNNLQNLNLQGNTMSIVRSDLFGRKVKGPFIQPPQPSTVMQDDNAILGQPSLIHVAHHAWLLVLPVTVPLDKQLEYLEFTSLIRIGDGSSAFRNPPLYHFSKATMSDQKYSDYVTALHGEPSPEILSAYPVHEFLSCLFTRTTELSATLSPQYMGISAGSITASLTDEQQYLAELPTVTGCWDNYTGQITWQFQPQKKQLITLGMIPMYVLIKSPSDDFSVTVSPYLRARYGTFTTESTFYGCDRTVDSDAKMTLKEYQSLHNAEISDSAATFIAGLSNDAKKQDAASYSIVVTPTPPSATNTSKGADAGTPPIASNPSGPNAPTAPKAPGAPTAPSAPKVPTGPDGPDPAHKTLKKKKHNQ